MKKKLLFAAAALTVVGLFGWAVLWALAGVRDFGLVAHDRTPDTEAS